MEDRLGAGLYLEMGGGEVLDRAPDLLSASGIDRVTIWENACPDRTDFPRKLPECSHLLVGEAHGALGEPGPGLKFERTARPGQGRLTGLPTLGLLLVLISPGRPGQAQELRDWADFVHLRHICEAAVPGFTMVTPYEHVGRGDPRFLHLYEMDTPEAERAFRGMTPLVQQRLGAGTAAFDEWATHPSLRIMYVNTFRRLEEHAR
jgi:hypothetical protein